MNFKLILLAPPGSGKGTQAALLQEKLEILHLSTGDALRSAVKQKTLAGIEAKKFMDAGDFVPDEIVLQIVKDTLSGKGVSGWILDGFPRNKAQAIVFDSIAKDLDQVDYQAIYLDVPEAVLLERIAGRYEQFKRNDDHPDVAPKRLETYHQQTAPLITFYRERNQLHMIDGNQSVGKVFSDIKKALGLE